MALLEDVFKGNVLTVAAIGLGALLLAPTIGQVLRPAAIAVIKGGMLAYQGLAELGEGAGDLAAETRPGCEAGGPAGAAPGGARCHNPADARTARPRRRRARHAGGGAAGGDREQPLLHVAACE